MGVKEMPKTTVKEEENKAGKKKEDLSPKAEEGKVEKKPEKKKGKEEVAAGKPEEKKEEKVEGETDLPVPESRQAGKTEVESKREEKGAEKVQVAAEEKMKPAKKEVKKGESKVEEVTAVKNEKASGGDVGNKIGEMIGAIEKMTVLELSDLVKALEERFGVVAVAPAAAGAASPATPAEEAKEKTEWSVMLTAIGEKKIQVIKEVRAITSLGLKEAKALVDEAPKPVKEGIPQKEAEEIKAKLEAVGATVELK
jgi:large subunit ribosomal protein L7/L12